MSLSLWLVDRSRYEVGNGRCARSRYLGYHAGDHGYGWARKAQSMPAITGTLIHDPITEGILRPLMETDQIPTDQQIHAAIVKAQVEYRRLVTTRGLTHTTDPGELELRTLEQCTLLEGLVWTWVAAALPAFHAEWQVVSVEEEFVAVLGCTCGLGDLIGTADEHDARACQAIGWMTRGDAIARRRTTGTLSYHDFKSTGMNSANWVATWAHRVQVMAGVLGYEQFSGEQVDEVYIHALYKGKNDREWDPDQGAAVGEKFQNSPLCYGWYRPANPPMLPEAWAASYNYVDDEGKRRKLGKAYSRVGVWTMDPALWQDALSPSHYWTRWIAPTGALGNVFTLIGPIYRVGWKLEEFERQLVAEEQHWQAGMWALYELAAAGHGWGDPAFHVELDKWFPQARGEACQNAFGDRCGFLSLCDRVEGWEDPTRLGFLPRTPHHTPELEAGIARGFLAPPAGGAEEEGD